MKWQTHYSKLCKKNEAEIGKKEDQIKNFWGWKVQIQKIKITSIYISFENLLTKEWPGHRQKSSLLM